MMNKIFKTFQLLSVAAFAAFFSIGTAYAQDEVEVTDEKLEAYIMVMDSVEVLQTQLQDEIGTLVKEHELMDGGRVFVEIRSAAGDTVALAEKGITPEQIAAFEEIQKLKEEKEAALKETFSSLVKEYVGISEYNTIRTGIRNDEELKERYEALLAETEEAEEEVGEAESAEAAAE